MDIEMQVVASILNICLVKAIFKAICLVKDSKNHLEALLAHRFLNQVATDSVVGASLCGGERTSEAREIIALGVTKIRS